MSSHDARDPGAAGSPPLRAGKDLAEDRLLLRAVIDAVPDPIFCKDREGRYLLHNVANQELVGAGDADYIGKTVHDFPGLKEHAALYHADDMQVIETGVPVTNREEPFTKPDGTAGWFLTSKYPLRNAAEEIVGLVGIARDVTGLKQAAKELEEVRQHLVDHVENSPLAVIEWEGGLTVQRWTGEAENMFGWSEAEVMGKQIRDWPFVHPDDAKKVKGLAAHLLEGLVRRNVCGNRNLTKAGKVIHCLWHNSALRGPDGQVISILSLVQDVTERVLAEETIREHERLYLTLIAATNTGYVQLDERGYVIEFNQEYLRLTGRTSRSDVVGHCVTEWTALHDLPRNARALAECARLGSVRNLEVDHVTPEGRIVPVEINARMDHTAAGPRIVAFCRDISDRRRTEAERHAFERKLQETQKLESLGVLAGGIAHDFNNLLTGILGNASLARMDAPADSPLQPMLEQIELASIRAAELCRQMLAYSGKGRFIVKHFDLNAEVEETARLLQISVPKKTEVQYELDAALPAVVGDLTQIRQVIMNLVINAAESIGDRGGKIVVATSLVHADRALLASAHLAPDLPEGDYVCLDVRDDGAGMEPDVRARIFDPFFTTKFTGRGLGLAAVLGIVRSHRGVLKVESTPGRGTSFQVLLPCADEPAGTEVRNVPASATWSGSGTVLVVDDEGTVRTTTARMLEALGFRVLLAGDGREGIERFAAHRDELVLVMLDWTMPHMDGEETLREIHRIAPSARVLLMSGFDESEVLARFAGQKFEGLLQKPFHLAALRDKLRQILAS